MENQVLTQQEEKAIREVAEQINELASLEELASLIQKNAIEFKIKDIVYRVKIPNFKEKLEVKEARSLKFSELITKGTNKPREILIQNYKKLGIDLDKLQDDINRLNEEINANRLKLAPLSDEKQRNKIREIILDLMTERGKIGLKIEEYLNECLEHQIEEYTNYFFVYLLLEKLVDEKWEKVFKTYDEFLNCIDGALLARACYYMTLINYGFDK